MAVTLDTILTSTLISEIGHQFFGSLLSLSFFSISVIIACFGRWTIHHNDVRNLGIQLNIFQEEARMCDKTQPLICHSQVVYFSERFLKL